MWSPRVACNASAFAAHRSERCTSSRSARRCRGGNGSVRLWQSSGLENRRSEAHIPGMATIVQCNCGAEYRRTEEKFLAPHTGDAVCTFCGTPSEARWKSTHVPTYELIERPTEDS